VKNLQVLIANSAISQNLISEKSKCNIIFIITNEIIREKFMSNENFRMLEAAGDKTFQSNVKKLRNDFTNQLDEISEKQDIRWEATRTAESNIMVNNFFRNIVMCQTIEDLVVDDVPNILVTDVEELIHLYSEKLFFKKLYLTASLNLKSIYKLTKSVTKFTISFCLSKILSCIFPNPRTDVIIHTFPNLNFKPNSKYQETYFPGLKEFYTGKNKTVSFLLSNTPMNSRKLFNFMNSQSFLVFNEYKYYSFIDFFKTVTTYLKLFFIKYEKFIINNYDRVDCLRISHKKYGLDFDVLLTLLKYQLFIKIQNSRYKPELLLLEFEGMIIEKMLIAGLRESKLETKVFGFQHMAIFDNMLCNFYTPHQIESNLLPDKIICSGEIYKDLYEKNGIPLNKLFVGPALRYRHIHEIATNAESNNKAILVLLPFNTQDCIFIINMFKQQLLPKINRVVLKPHPKSDVNVITKLAKVIDCQIVNDPINSLLTEFSVVASMNSGSLLDAALLGKFVIKLNRPFFIDLDPLFRNRELRLEVNSKAELKEVIDRIPDELEIKKMYLDCIKKEYFNPFTENLLETFSL
jgi:hypothetical protein